ncbi:hypothetical protein LCGC14_1583520 [marine sediment metagenome]|uniref:Uncharacterized protein n=1 Tax=marine sediment metagenome TaxID=412755 RepID=A0A0F9IG72_9ZZZZ
MRKILLLLFLFLLPLVVQADTLTLYSTPSERARGISFAEQFESQTLVERNGGAVTGSPTFSPDGVTLDGTTDYLTYALTGREFSSAGITVVCEFTPDFETNEDATRYLFDASDGHRYLVHKYNNIQNNTLKIHLGHINIASIPEAAYSPFWNVGTRNILVVSSTTGDTSAWLNGNLILDAAAIAWSAKTPTQLFAGARFNGIGKFKGTIHRLQVFKTQLSDAEVQDISDNTTYHYRNDSTLHLPFGTAEHDPGSVRTLDVSGSGAHAIFGDGSTPTTYPTKLTDHHGYDYDGGDYLVVPATGLLNSVGVTFAIEFTPDFETGVNVAHYLCDGTDGNRYLVAKQDNADNNALDIYLGNVLIESIAEAAYSPYWRKGRRNVLVLTGDATSNRTNTWLNEGQILTEDTTAWSPANPSSFYIGTRFSIGFFFDGEITYFKVFPQVLTRLQILDLQKTLSKRVSKQ